MLWGSCLNQLHRRLAAAGAPLLCLGHAVQTAESQHPLMKSSNGDRSPNFMYFLLSSCSSDVLKRSPLTKCCLSDQWQEQQKQP